MRVSTIWRMAWRAWRRDWRQRESRVIALALVVAVAAMTSVGFFVERVERAMDRQAATVLGGDLAISSSRPFDEPLMQAAQAEGLASARHVEFPSVVLAGDRSMLAQIKAVGEGYPLRGELRIQHSPDDEAVAVGQGPAPGELWVEARLLAQLEREVGEVVSLGHRELRIGAVLAFEPDRSTNLFQLAPRAMLNLADLESTGLISPASRVRYTWLLAGADADVARWQARLERELGQHASLRDTRNAQPELQTALDRAARFLGLAALIST
ncbi:MAG: ABC transporter permease, partial [Gammaproteobacteria bacterium]|nr:ABC transporter permease [Gammaproteobacteria bacterium]